MMAHTSPLEKGDSVGVKPGVMCPDVEGLSLSGWQGRVFEVAQDPDGQTTIGIRWDSLTLAALPENYLVDCAEHGCEGVDMYLDADDVERAEPRDTEKDAGARAEVVRMKCFWLGEGAQGRRILDVVGRIAPDDERKLFSAWHAHLKRGLTFPVAAQVYEPQERGPLNEGDKVQVVSFAGVEDTVGVLAKVRHGSREYIIPLCDLDVVSHQSPARPPVGDYRVCFANR